MKDFPREILSELFFYLHPRHKIECMLVCRRWKQVIETLSFYRDIDIRSEESFDKLMSIVKENPAKGDKVERVMISSSTKTDDVDLYELIRLFPHMRTLICLKTSATPSITFDDVLFTYNNHIEYIYELSQGLVTYHLLSFYRYPNLTTLNIGDYGFNVVNLVENAPALKNLTIRNIFIAFYELDILHKRAPRLESLTAGHLILDGSGVRQDVDPAVSITEVHFDKLAVVAALARKDVLTYVSKKYPNLSTFTCTFSSAYTNNNTIEKLTESDWLPLLENVGSQLKKISLCNNSCFDNFFELLDKFDCQIEHVKVQGLTNEKFMNIMKSNQVLYIQTLIVDLTDFETFGWLSDLVALKHLELSHSTLNNQTDGLDLNTIFNHSPPTLRSLSLRDIQLVANPECTTSSNIDTVSFDQIKIPKGIDTFISQSLPNLSNLTLTTCDVIGGVFNLETMDILRFSYTTPVIVDGIADILIVTSANKERRWYDIRAGDGIPIGFPTDIPNTGFYSPIKSHLQREVDTNPHFTLLCKSLNTCTFI